MHTHNHVRAPFFERLPKKPDSPLIKELASFGPEPVNSPIEIFHPVLLISQNPVIESD
jgi:hypothetical protein